MRRQLKCAVVLLSLLLAALSPVAVAVATARRELRPLMAAISDEGRQDASSSSGTTAPGATAATVKTNRRRFRRTSSGGSWKMPAASPRFNFGGRRIPFTADYHTVHRHPPSHN